MMQNVVLTNKIVETAIEIRLMVKNVSDLCDSVKCYNDHPDPEKLLK